ncbi:MAG: sedoheptulose 7-phosphate cyclase, partial [Planctomycetota bacterium]
EFFSHMVDLTGNLNPRRNRAGAWEDAFQGSNQADAQQLRVLKLLKQGRFREEVSDWSRVLEQSKPHAIYPTSVFRKCSGHVAADSNFTAVEATISSQTHTSIRVVEDALNPDEPILASVYRSLSRCVCLIDKNVDQHFGSKLEDYFRAHNIELVKLVYRAMEVDKGIRTVEKILGDFKTHGVARNEPVLVAGGGVLSDVGGLACSIYHRGTPYVMLSTSLVAGVDAGPSPRTCCDGFGFKNLFGAYHAPVLSVTDRKFFSTLKPGWIRHGIAEIIKMATVKDLSLFEDLEAGGARLIDSRFGNVGHETSEISEISQRIIAKAITSYVDAEYGNLYETHQCRPHAFGHTWSPGFEIPAGLLHGHAVSVGMGLGAFLSEKMGWIEQDQMNRIHRLIQSFGLSLWNDHLSNHDLIWQAQVKMVEKRGGQLVAPLPINQVGQCGYLPSLNQANLINTLKDYQRYCRSTQNKGLGVEPLCSDVGLESAGIVGC